MSCPDGKHDLRAVNPFVHPESAVEVVGAPPQTETEPAWCGVCGALWAKRPFGFGWGFLHHSSDTDAPTILNIVRKKRREEDEDLH